jgi:endonuclease/exonuclease/phosphatase (EEP) superfamily protein YafD
MVRRIGSVVGARRYWALWLVVVPLGLWALVRGFGLDGGTPIAFMLAFTPQVAVAAFLATGVAVALRNWAAGLVAGVATALLVVAVLPRAIGGAETPPPGSAQLDVLSANVYVGNADPEALLALVDRYDPDLLAIQELTPGFDRRLRAAGVRRLLPYTTLRSGSTKIPRGQGVYSRLPIRNMPGHIGWATLTLPGRVIRIANVHPVVPSPGAASRWRNSLSRLPSSGSGPPWVLLGDFNATLDHAALREVLSRGYRDAGEVTGNGLVPTWPVGRPFPPQVTIDHVFADSRLGIADYGVDDVSGTDHRAVHASLFIPPSK